MIIGIDDETGQVVGVDKDSVFQVMDSQGLKSFQRLPEYSWLTGMCLKGQGMNILHLMLSRC